MSDQIRKIRYSVLVLFAAAVMVLLFSSASVRAESGSELFGTESGSQSSAGTRGSASKKKGWYTNEDGNTYYYNKNGERLKGWQKIRKKWYYFSMKNSRLQKNRIVGNKTDGYYYVDENGIRVTDKVICQAVALVRANTKSSWSPERKLRAMYNYICKKCVYQRFYDKEDISKMPSYAKYMMTNRKGNCYRGAAALAYCAKVLGYDSGMGIGAMTSRLYGELSLHGWTEVVMDGNVYLYDTSVQRHHWDTNLGKILFRDYPYRIRRDKGYKLHIVNGKPVWEME